MANTDFFTFTESIVGTVFCAKALLNGNKNKSVKTQKKKLFKPTMDFLVFTILLTKNIFIYQIYLKFYTKKNPISFLVRWD